MENCKKEEKIFLLELPTHEILVQLKPTIPYIFGFQK